MNTERDELLERFAERTKMLLEAYCKTCVQCLHFDTSKELCTLAKPPARPPAKVIAFGCDAYDNVPF